MTASSDAVDERFWRLYLGGWVHEEGMMEGRVWGGFEVGGGEH